MQQHLHTFIYNIIYYQCYFANYAYIHAQAEDQPVDDGSGKLTVWVVKDFKKELVDPAQHGYVIVI